MEMELKNLIDKIKTEGVNQAEKEAGDIISQAKEKAKQIIKDAEEKKTESIKEAEIRTREFRKAAEKALTQAARDVLLSLRGRVTEFFDRVVKEKISKELTPDVLKKVIVKVVENFRKDSMLDIEVLVSKDDAKKLQKALFATLSKEAKAHLTLTGSSGIETGFRIGEKGKDSYFDFTDEAIAEAFTRYLNPKLVEILDIDLGLGEENAK